MKTFHCDNCGQLVFFENVACLRCGHKLAYFPDSVEMRALEPAGDGRWRRVPSSGDTSHYRLCHNYSVENVCNWTLPAGQDDDALCEACRLTTTIPNLAQPTHREAWYRLEVAKRRLVYTLQRLGLPIVSREQDPEHGIAFEFLAGTPGSQSPPVTTGHASGVITIDLAEAYDDQRERRRVALGEPYRTLVGHFRHEIGHWYWDRLIRDSSRLDAFRALFGDEREDYAAALKRYYEQGAPADWQQRFVSAYAASHPWEDWAETWAHYLHITDTLEMASAIGLSLDPGHPDEPALATVDHTPESASFARMMRDWYPVTYVANNLNRGLGLPDAYPFAISPGARAKLRFVHETCEAARQGAGTTVAAGKET